MPQDKDRKVQLTQFDEHYFKTLDIQSIRIGGPSSIRYYELDPGGVPGIACDIAIIGGGTGGFAAALTLLDELAKTPGRSLSIILTEETDWLGGQMTSQGVSALDENKYIETTGGAKSYLRLRQAIRQAYRDSGKLKKDAFDDPLLHPGRSWVTRLSFEPRLCAEMLDKIIIDHPMSSHLQILKRHKAIAAKRDKSDNGHISAILLADLDSEATIALLPQIVLDATETGDLLALANIPYRLGSDSRQLTGEAHAPRIGNDQNVQDYTYPFAIKIDNNQGVPSTGDEPPGYVDWVKDGQYSLYGYKMFAESEGRLPFFTYRRLIDKELFEPGAYQSDISMINWDANDLRGYNFIDQDPQKAESYLLKAKALSLGFLLWLQTEVPRDDGSGKGYPEFCLIKDLFGTDDGLSKYPYIRESRRLAAKTMIVEQDIVASTDETIRQSRAKHLTDSIGIGLYPVDIHGYQEIPGAAQAALPFQIPYSAMITDACPNYLASCKNIGVSHITNGAYRLHPIEWSIGVAAACAAALALDLKQAPNTLDDADQIEALQIKVLDHGSPIFWLDDLPVLSTAPDIFTKIQMACQLDPTLTSPANLEREQKL